MHSVTQQMQQDRIIGNFTHMSYDERVAELRQMGAANWQLPHLPMSPCIRVKATGEIHAWAPFFAERPDLCENCDEHGNTDPAAWQGKIAPGLTSEGKLPNIYEAEKEEDGSAEASPEVSSQESPALPTRPELEPPAGLAFYFDEFSAGDDSTPQIQMASAVLGVPQGFVQEYTGLTASKSALPVGGDNAVVGDLIQRAFDTFNPV